MNFEKMNDAIKHIVTVSVLLQDTRPSPDQEAKGSIRIKKCHKKWKKSTRGGKGQQKTSKSPKFEIWTF